MTSDTSDPLEVLRGFIRAYPASLQVVDVEGITRAASAIFLRTFDLTEAELIDSAEHVLFSSSLFRKEGLSELLKQALEGESVTSGLVELELANESSTAASLYRLQFFPITLADFRFAGIRYENLGESATLQRKLYAKNAELESFVYTVSHDLKSPLAVIDGCVDLLQETAGDDKYMQKNLAMIDRSAMRIGRLANALLSLSRVGRDTGDVEDMLPTGKLIKSVYMEYIESMPELESSLELDELPDIIADSSSVTHLFQNLIGNAIKYRQPGKPLQIRVSAKVSKRAVIYSVADNGLGIDPKDQKRIFEVFYRGENSSSDAVIEGTGVGLAIVKKVIDQLGGRLWVESEPGSGSTFYFSIPRSGNKKKRP